MATLTLISSRQEAGNIKTFVFDGTGFSWVPGQYQTYVLPQVGGNDDAKQRFFTIASAPSEGTINISTRISASPFKQALDAMQPGDTIEANGIEGDFTWDNDEPAVFVAGGIGVTPFRSMLVERAATGKPMNALLLYFGRDENLAFKDEFDKIASEHPELAIKYVIGESISADTILAHAPLAQQRTVFMSGPEAMVDAVGEELKARGVNLKQDWFPGYDEQTY